MKESNQDKRQFPRARFTCKIVVKYAFPHELISHTENISVGGVRVFLDELIDYRTELDIELHLKKAEPIRCKGRVVWIKKQYSPLQDQTSMYDTGISFFGLSQEDKEYIKKVVKQLLEFKEE